MNKRNYNILVCGMVVAILFLSYAIVKELHELNTNNQTIESTQVEYDDGHLPGDDTVAIEPVEDYENEKIEEALVDQGYFRDDIPLSYENQDYLQTACNEFDVPYALMLGLIERETGFCNSIGDNGKSFGYCQVQPYWHKERMANIGATDLMNPFDNFRTACNYLSELMDGHTLSQALTAYNRGVYGESEYAQDVIKNMKNFEILLDNN